MSSKSEYQCLRKSIDLCLLKDRPGFYRRLRKLNPGKPSNLAQLELNIQQSAARLVQRRADLPKPEFPDKLPIVDKKDEIASAILRNQVIIVCGETGSGKTTQLPKILLELGIGAAGIIGHTQPRRIAAHSVAARIADELKQPLGLSVGYKIRFTDRVGENAYIKLMTDGILLNEVQNDRLLIQYEALIIDEAHERSLNIDFILGYLKHILPKRPDFKLIVTSATIDPESFSRHFSNAPVIEVSGRGYPVEIRYHTQDQNEPNSQDLQQDILDAVDELSRLPAGDILVFLPTERDIRETAESLRKHHPQQTEVLPLYARLSAAEQNRVFQTHKHRRIVLATNVAETSLTVPGIKYVIDTGTARISRYSIRSKVQRLPIEPVSQASAKQRTGRCGRTSPGICIRLYTEEDFENRAAFTVPEIQRTNLAAVILQMRQLKLGEVEMFPFINPPDRRYINDGYKLLEELSAINDQRQLTNLGRQLARLPLDPRLGRMVLEAERVNCLHEVLIIVSSLAVQDPRERPLEKQNAADEQHKDFKDERSDFLSLLKLWEYLREQEKHLSKTKFRKLCKQRFLSYTRIREWEDVLRQLRSIVLPKGIKENQAPADYATIHQALLSGLLSHIGFRDDERTFTGARNRSFLIFPGSSIANKPPKWVMAAELVETSKLFARTAAKIEPRWVENAALHLLKREYFEPHWQPRSAQVAAFERVSLYGLILVQKRRINFGPINPKEAHEIFIREALVAGRYRTNLKFLRHNMELIEEIATLEAKSRSRDILISEDDLYDFYAEHIPQDIYNGNSFEKWLKNPAHSQNLMLTKKFLMRRDGAGIGHHDFPDDMNLNGVKLKLEYHFEPGADNDGVTLSVPLQLLNQMTPQRCEWLVPGLLKEKIVALIKAFPKSLRKNFVPAPDFAQACLEALTPYDGALLEKLSSHLKRITGVGIPTAAWRIEAMPNHLRLRIRVIDENGEMLAIARDITQLQKQLGDQVNTNFESTAAQKYQRSNITCWNFGELPKSIRVNHGGLSMTTYPVLVDDRDSVSIQLRDTVGKAALESRSGLRRLYMLALSTDVNYLSKNLSNIQRMCLLYRTLGRCETLKEELIETTFDSIFIDDKPFPRDADQFAEQLESGQPQLVPGINRLCENTAAILDRYQTARQRLGNKIPLDLMRSVTDIKDQLGHLIYSGFIRQTPTERLQHLPRYLEAITHRLDRLAYAPAKDTQLQQQLEPWWQRYKQHLLEKKEMTPTETVEFTRYRWMIEEFRVSLFAQSLGTSLPISAKRLEQQWRKVFS